MTESERNALDTLVADLREEASEIRRIQNVITERGEVLAEVANRLERAFVQRQETADVGDITPAQAADMA